MPRVFRRAAVTVLAVTLLAGAAAPGAATADSLAGSKAAAQQNRPELQEAIQGFVDIGFTGMQMRVNDQRGEWAGTAGVRKLGQTAKPPTNGRFRIGSNAKTFVATVVLQLVAEGKIGLDAPVAGYLPQFELDREITVRMLLQHTSGLFNYTGDYYNGKPMPGLPSTGQEWVDNRFRTYQPDELVRFALAKGPLFLPGRDWNYSNTNYVLAALLIEKATGRSYAEEMQRRILRSPDAAAPGSTPQQPRPLGLSGTEVPGTRTGIRGPHAHGYYRYQDAGQWKTVDVTRQNPSLVFAAGDMISTTQDLHTFFSALMSGKLLPAPLLAEMRTPHSKVGYGLGVYVEKLGCGVTVVRHNGNNIGYGALMYSTPDGSKTLTASITGVDTEVDLATKYPKALDKLLKAAFCGEQTAG
ncbi:serine hydrolase domain-containing protein [Amycolatopsis lurida]|uniref:Alkaline D-peptidase n=1 Tax=Amycolatopsis lurida NRRL 2430 TaxID=1460371 RepID=A0A2P2FI20_AMYLU|nr:serine hydrolase domain-containing protein [Amycolatopsis lurida]KFU76371.1 alkaline D-peptidase [Amycolatopsis lurida NRRL 2430]